MELVKIAAAFLSTSNLEITPIKGGLINRTFLVENKGSGIRYILQNINQNVFTNPKAIVNNHFKINKKLKAQNFPYCIVEQVLLPNNDLLLVDDESGFWRMTKYLDQSLVYEEAPNAFFAQQAAEGFGCFYTCLNDGETVVLEEVLPDFLNFEKRINDYKKALVSAKQERLSSACQEIDFVNKWISLVDLWLRLEKNSELPKRVVHCDPKISNVLFNKNGNLMAIIDLDTTTNATILYDFGDMIRSYTNLSKEDDLLPVFSSEIYDAVKRGFLCKTQSWLTKAELENLDYAAKVIIYIQAVRFLTDYLNNDRYYQIAYEGQNLNRTKNQISLLEQLMDYKS